MSEYDEIPPDHKKEITEKPQIEEKTNKETLFNEWAEKIYRASETVWKTLVAFQSFPDRAEEEKFRNEMHKKRFGEFVSVFQSNAGILYLKIGDYEIAADYYPEHHHIEKIKNFLSKQGEKYPDAAQEILMQIAAILITARMIKGKILYHPEIEEMEKKIAELKNEMKEIMSQLEIVSDMFLYTAHGIESNIQQGMSIIYSTRNKLAGWRDKFKK